MRSFQAESANFFFKYMSKPFQAFVPINPFTIERMREFINWVSTPLKRVPSFVTIEKVMAGGTSSEWVIAGDQKKNRRVLIYIHGGGYVFFSPETHRPITWRLSRDAGVKVLSLDYRMLPEHGLEDSWADTLNAYQWLLSEGYKAEHIVIGGDSAGGALTLQLLFQIRDKKLPMPCAAFCISPFADMTFQGKSVRENAHNDHMFFADFLGGLAKYIADRYGEKNPCVSPVFGTYEGLPPLLIQVSDTELLYSDALLIKEKAESAGCDVHFKEWENMPHVFPILSNLVPEAKAAIKEIAGFVKDKLK